ncbi:hypothetical protein BJ684DRAFT_15664 [Piptocephalis cylindrospora]|uniref:Uncharacterized protein n=1 Tax=Piptocephalis cylindrospora TaxID=1907219 RepID=A0A4P9Y4Y9_9FUNG|nr:hypothetical protein BJ684DRAFT_15664 [Piptocephalis cylindrospora]|eukprot:RKP13985.1 hypothetical protein BJ684DRAFT_15664 [Piptocephalis cylindrospora]
MLRLSLFSLVRRAPSRLVAAPKARFSSWTSPQQSWWSRHPILSTLGGVTLGSALYVGYQYQQRVLVYPSAVRAHLRRGLFACQKGDFLSAQEPFAKAYAEARASPSLTQDGQAMLGLVARYIDVLEAVNDTDTAIRVLQDTFSTLLHPPFSSSSSPIPPKTLSTPKITIDLAVRLADLLEDTGDTEGCARALLWSLFHMLSKAPQAMQPPSFGSIPDMRKAMADWSSVEDVAAVMERLARLYFVQGRIDASLGLYRRLLPLLPESQVTPMLPASSSVN